MMSLLLARSFALRASRLRSSLAATALVAVAPFAVGCGASPTEEPQYPSSEMMPVGVDGPSQEVAAGDPSQAPQPLPLSGEAQAQEGAIPGTQQGTTTIPGAEGDVALGEDAQQPDSYGDTDPSALQDFKPALDPYGHWVDDGTYGTVWVPAATTVGTDFTPYVSGGHWAYDNDQYLWVSDYSWGWAPFHYGRWVYTGGYGWGWIPGRTYAGAWVSWRTGYNGYGYVGWAPTPPNWYWRGGVAVGVGFVPRAPYVFCPTGHLFEPGFRNNIVRGSAVATVAQNTRPYVQAAPAAHSVAHPTVSGPSPQSMGIASNQITHANTPAAQAQVARAQSYSHPSTAVAQGAHPPTNVGANSGASRTVGANSGASRTVGANSGASRTVGSNASASAYASRNAYAGSYGSSHTAVAGAQQYRGISPTPYRAPSSSYSRSTSGVTRIGGGYSGAPYSAPHASPSYSAPRYSTPSYSTPYVQHSSGGYTAPHYTPPAPSAPVVHSSGGGGGYRGGGGGGGHSSGGGHGGHR